MTVRAYECRTCGGSGEVERDHAYWQDGATQYGSVVLSCPSCGGSGEEGPSYDDLDGEDPTEVGMVEVRGIAVPSECLDGDLAEVEQLAHHIAGIERDADLAARVARVRAMRGVWS